MCLRAKHETRKDGLNNYIDAELQCFFHMVINYIAQAKQSPPSRPQCFSSPLLELLIKPRLAFMKRRF